MPLRIYPVYIFGDRHEKRDAPLCSLGISWRKPRPYINSVIAGAFEPATLRERERRGGGVAFITIVTKRLYSRRGESNERGNLPVVLYVCVCARACGPAVPAFVARARAISSDAAARETGTTDERENAHRLCCVAPSPLVRQAVLRSFRSRRMFGAPDPTVLAAECRRENARAT